MDAALRLSEPAASQARCQSHPERSVLGACSRCGTFFCELDWKRVDGRDYCAPCAARPDVDYLEAFRLKYWGRRDAWAWFIGLGSLFHLATALSGLVSGIGQEKLYFVPLLVVGAVGVCFWFGMPFARRALWFIPLVFMVGVALFGNVLAALLGVVPLLFAAAIYQDTRNRLFFKQPVSRNALQKAWHLYANNTVARTGFQLSLFGLLFPVFAPFGLVCSLVGLRRVDLEARPPVGRKGQAIAGIVLGAVSLLGWGSVLLTSYFSGLGH